MKPLLCILVLLFSFCSNAQNVSGVVRDADDNKALENVMVSNRNTGAWTFSDKNGKFSIKGLNNEIIDFSLMGYDAFLIKITPSTNNENAVIFLKRDIVSLEEILITPGLTPYQRDSIQRRITYAKDLNRVKESSVMSPFSLVLQYVMPKSKTRWQFQKNFQKWEGEEFVATRYTPELVSEMTQLEGNAVYQFMAAYPMEKDYAYVASDLEIKMWIRNNYKQWMKKPEKDRLIALPDSILK